MYKSLKNLYKENPRILYNSIILNILVGMVNGLPLAVIYFTIRDIIDASLTKESMLLYIGSFLLACFLVWFVRKVASKKMTLDTYLFLGEKRIYLGDHIRKLSMGFFGSKDASQLGAIMTQDFDFLEMAGNVLLEKYYMTSIASMVAFLFLSFVNWKLALVTFLGVPLALYLIMKRDDDDSQATIKRQEIQGELSANTIDFVSGIKEIKAFGKSDESLKNYTDSIQAFRDVNLSLVGLKGPKVMKFKMAISICMPLVLFLGIYMYKFTEEISLPLALIFLLVSLKIYVPLEEIGGYQEILSLIQASLVRVNKIFSKEPLDEKNLVSKLNKFDVEVRDVTFSYDQKVVLNNVSFKVKEKSMTALVGHSGSGKTTVTNLIARFWDVNKGQILVGGHDVRDIENKELLSHMSMVFQDVFLFNDTIMNNIKFAKTEATDEEVYLAAQKAMCHDFIMALPDGYQTVVGENGKKLSGGERQRVSIARAILKDAEIILLDEATANIDPENEVVIQKAIDKLVENKTIIIIAHKLSTIKNADQIVVLDQGEISQIGVHDDLKEVDGIYRSYWLHREQANKWKIAN
ncbi:ABC transporter ATP-binding protein [Acidaminobacter sp. JC074]|uniref:ABC transporter ATP-binding protein n=1 Tax=Acidaminobacter sp. JC074 TaxID=2530199 RepID=UPI001F0EEC11|nr:ABC transporter ATP-binding protein [Acidaminobacter sp. JC074]MCH4891030.1 ABC transporter ATP-binding protein [Acidaminobacter sp. JC074]